MLEWVQRYIPDKESLQARPGLRWLAPLLGRPGLWQLNRRRVAVGAAIGVFCGLLIPVAQIAGAALLAVMLRANLPVAAIATLVSNPVTIGPILVLAYKTGASVLGERVVPEASEALSRSVEESVEDIAAGEPPAWVDRARAVWKPLFLGLIMFAVVGSLATWVIVHVAWTAAVFLKRKRRRNLRR
jgi:uncharacterized protein (DUF2062 family)